FATPDSTATRNSAFSSLVSALSTGATISRSRDMRVEAVYAEAFGALIDAELALAPGMTVVCGPNESAKSTWHAAIYAALCGLRRGKGAKRADDRAFEALHRPWDDPSAWAVRTRVLLDSGRRLELRQDLVAGLESYAHDLTAGGRDVINEVMHEGAPDAAL